MGTPARVEGAGNTRRALTAVGWWACAAYAAAPAGNVDARAATLPAWEFATT